MIRTLDFNAFAAGTIVDDEYLATDGVTISASGGSGQAMIFDSANPTGDDDDLASDTLGGVLIISEDGDSSDPDDNTGGGSIFFDFESGVRIKSLTFKDIEETTGEGTRMIFYDADGNVIENQFVQPTGDGGEQIIGINVPGVSRMEVVFQGSGAIDNLVFDDTPEADPGPNAVDDFAETDEDVSVVIDLRSNDTDPDNANSELVIGDFFSPNGTVVDNGDGTVTFTPDENFNGDALFTYTVTDPDGNSDTGTTTVTVNPVNDAPIANDDSAETTEGEAVVVDLRGNDTDIETPTEELVISDISSPDGTVVDNGDGTVTFTPADGFTGPATITYTVSDPDGGSDEGTATVTVTENPDTAPVAVDDVAETEEDTTVTIDLLGNDIDPDNTNDELTLTAVSVPAAQGTVTDNGDGTVDFTPAENFNGDATITYTVSDPDGQTDEGQAFVTVTPVNDGPIANPDVLSTDEDTPSDPLNVLDNDSDPDGDPLELISATSTDGTVEFTPEGEVIFTPNPDFNGETTIEYIVTDPSGAETPGTVTVTVNPINDAPVTAPDTLITDEDTASEPLNVLDNDSDADGDPLELISATSTDGTVEFTPEGEVIFTPNPDFNGETTIEYVVTDPSGAETPGTVTVTVNPINDAPDAVDDADTTDEDTEVTVDLLANDTDVDGDDLTVTEATVPAEQGTLVNNGDGTVTFTPAMDFNGTATISYTISDGNGGEDSAVHTIAVGSENDAPVTGDDTLETDEDTPSDPINVLDNDSDPDGDPLELISATSTDGTVEFTPEGEVIFTPNPDFNGETTIEYVVTDPSGAETPGTVTVTVNPINDAPVTAPDTLITDEDTASEPLNVLDNDSDPDGDPLELISATSTDGTVEFTPEGEVIFTPNPDFNGETTIEYVVTDPSGAETPGTVTVTVNPINDAPVTAPDTLITDEDTASEPLNVLDNDSDADGDPLELISATSTDGTVEFTPEGEVIFTPNPDFNGETTIEYVVTDPSGAETPGTVTVTVNPINDAPDAVDDIDTTAEDEAITVDLLANDSDPDGDDLTVVSASVDPAQGTLVDNGDGTVTFTPVDDFVGEVTITYTIEDGNGGTDTAEHTVYVNAVSDPPEAADDVAETQEDTPVTIDVLGNDIDPDGDTLFISDASVPEEQGTVEIVDGQLVFTPAENFNGEVTIDYVAKDPDGNTSPAQVVVTVTPVNDAPDAVDDSDITDINTPVTVDLLANDSDVEGGPLTVTFAEVPAAQGTLVDNGDGTVTFTPADGFLGEATISYTIADEDGLEDSAVHTITVNDPASAPTANPDTGETPEDTPVTIDVLENDTDPQGDPLTITSATVPEEQGTVEIVDNELVFTPADDFNGPATISYTVEDPDGNAGEGTATVDVTPVNDAPVAEDDEDTTDFNTSVTVDLLANDTDVDGDTLTVSEATVPAEQGTLVDNGDGTVTFTPVDGFEGEAVISYTISDGNGGADLAVHVITVGDNAAPVAVDDTAETPEDTPVIVDLIGNDTDENGDPLTLVEATVPEEQGTLTDNGDGTVTFTPAPDYNGPATITYTVTDPSGATDEGTATVEVTPVNDAPDAVDDVDVTDLNTPVTVDLLANDTDVDGDTLTVVEATVPAAQGTLVDNGDGTVTFTPATDFTGDATITYTIEDAEGLQDTALHTITVNADDSAPVAEDDTAETPEDTPVTIDVLANDTDPQDDPLTITFADVPAEQGTVEIVDNELVFTPAEDFNGPVEITYIVEDPDGNADEGTVTVDVTPVNDAPDAVDDSDTTEEDTPVVLDLVDNDSDPEGDPLTVVAVSVPEEQGTVVNNGDGSATFTPADGFNGEATITYTVADPDGAEDTAVHTVTVTPINDAPDAVDDGDMTPEDTPITVDLLANDTDEDGDSLRVVEASVPEEQGTLVDNGDGTVTFTPAPDFNGPATISYTISDGQGGEDSAEHVILVGEENDPPVTEPDTIETDEDTPSDPINVLDNDSDPDGDPLTLISATSPDGTVEFTPEGEVIFTPDPDFNGETTIDYVITDPFGEEVPGTVTVTVNPVNDAPDAVDDVDVTPEDTAITVDLLANDSDVDGDMLTVVEATVPAEQGTLVDNGDGTVTFTPAEDFVGEVVISYTIEDEEGLQDSAIHTVYVNEVSDGPTAVDDVAETPEDTPVTIDVLANDEDPDSPDLIILEASVPEEQGTVEIVDNEIVFTPAPDFNGEATIDYVAQDPDGNTSPAQAVVTVTPVNDAPVAEDDSDITDLNTPVTVDLLANDSDVDGDDLTVVAATVPAEQGTLVDNGDGTVTFTPVTGFTGEATISYTIEDEDGLQDSAVHTITVNDTPNAPTAVDDTAETPEDTPITIDVLDNDTDPNDDPLTIVSAEVPEEQGTVEIVDGELVFTPAEDFNGPVEITYVIEDPDGNRDEGTVTVDVTPVNDAPVAEDDADTTDINTPVTVDLLANDFDVDGDDLTVTMATVPAEQGTLVNNGDGTVTFTPATDFVGEATISYEIRDEEGLTDTAVHTITIVDDNTPPVAVDDTAETPEDTPVIVDLIGNDTDEDGDPLTLVSATVPEEQGTLVDNGDGTVTFTPAPDFNGPATITYVVADPDGEEDEGEAVVTVTPVNDAPLAEDDTDITDLNTPVTVDLLANDSDVDGDDLTVIAATVPAEQGTLVDNGDGTVTFTPATDFTGEATISYTIEDEEGLTDSAVHTIIVNDTDNAPTAVDDIATTDEDTPVTIDATDNDTDPTDDPLTIISAEVPEEQGTVDIVDNELVFTPAEDFTGEATITYIIEDPDGNADEAVVTVTVDPVNDAPDAVDDVATTEEDTPVVIDLVDNDSDPDGDPLTVVSVSVPPEQGTVVDNGDGTATFTPAPDFVGEATVTYTVADPDGAEDTAVHVIDVTPINDRPDAVDDSDATAYNTPITVDLLANDTDPEGDPLTVISATVPEDQGTLVDNGDGTVTFTPIDGFVGDATITYTIEDDGGLRDTAEHVITVNDGDRDGIVEGTGDPDLIDVDYRGDPDGDVVDGLDEILPGQGPNDDIILAGDGDDTVLAGEGDDSVEGGEGDDSIFGEEGSDTVNGGEGDDFIDTSGPDLAPDDGYPFADTDPLGYGPDADPENDRDSVDGGDGNDTIATGDDRDTIRGGDGDDVINGGIDDDDIDGGEDDDRIVGGEGDDTIAGGSGDDTIYAGNDPDVIPDVVNIPDEPTDDAPFSPDRNPDNGRDVVDGGSGNDLIFGADDDDTLLGGSGNDTIDGEIDDDFIQGGTGDDSLIGGQGDDSIDGGQDDDILEGGTGDDTLRGNRDNDTLLGGDGDDVLDGGGEDDVLEGGDGDDDMMGGQGDDTLRGGDGADTMTGGAGQDVFEDVGAGDVIDGGSAPIDFDTLDLRDSAPEGGSLEITYTSDDREDGVVNYFDEDGNDAGQLVFEEIENIIPCFTPGTKIATPKGERLVEELQVGDRVITRDNGIQEIRWVGARDMSGDELEKAAHLKPVLIRQGALGNDLPERDMMVSPNHRVLVANDKTALYFEEREVLVAAKHLTGLEGVDVVDVSHTTYIHIMFDQHEVILSDGTWTESFQPGDMSLAGIGNAQRQEILELFPELATQEGIEGYASARRSLKKHEAKLITK